MHNWVLVPGCQSPMQMIPADILEQYSAVLKKRAVPVSCHADYRKWLRYFLDFRSKYPLPEPKSEQVRLSSIMRENVIFDPETLENV